MQRPLPIKLRWSRSAQRARRVIFLCKHSILSRDKAVYVYTYNVISGARGIICISIDFRLYRYPSMCIWQRKNTGRISRVTFHEVLFADKAPVFKDCQELMCVCVCDIRTQQLWKLVYKLTLGAKDGHWTTTRGLNRGSCQERKSSNSNFMQVSLG